MMLARFLRLGVIVGPLPNTLANGTLADATQVMADLNWIVNQVNTNAAAGGASSIGAPNLLINGAMLIAQRIGGTTSSKTITALRDYAVDRWQYACAGTINSSLIGSIGLPGFPFAQRIQRPVSGSSTSPLTVAQSLESSDSYALAGSTVTFSFWARSGANFSALGSLVTAVISSGTGTDESILKPYTGLATVAVNTFALSSGWRQFILTGIVSASATEVGISISYTPTGTAGSADYFDVTGCKLEIGNAASAYVTESFAATLAQCQRYYQKSFPYTVVPVVNALTGYQVWYQVNKLGATNEWTIYLPVTMRDAAGPAAVILNPYSSTFSSLIWDVDASLAFQSSGIDFAGGIGRGGGSCANLFGQPNASSAVGNRVSVNYTIEVELL